MRFDGTDSRDRPVSQVRREEENSISSCAFPVTGIRGVRQATRTSRVSVLSVLSAFWEVDVVLSTVRTLRQTLLPWGVCSVSVPSVSTRVVRAGLSDARLLTRAFGSPSNC
jgi:hypothetical protein